jgi:hypothetical protein
MDAELRIHTTQFLPTVHSNSKQILSCLTIAFNWPSCHHEFERSASSSGPFETAKGASPGGEQGIHWDVPRFSDLGTTLGELPVGIHEARRHQSSDFGNS